MARNVQLSQILRDIRAFTGRSLSVAQGLNDRDALIAHANQIYRGLVIDHDWEHLYIQSDVPLFDGTRYYDFPIDLEFEYVQNVWVEYGSSKIDLDYGVGPPQFVAYNSAQGEKSWPPRRWMIDGRDPDRFEVWPVPDQNATLCMWGRRTVPDMVADSDICLLDQDLVSLTVAGEILQRNRHPDAEIKLAQANSRLLRLLQRQRSHKRTPVVLGGGLRRQRRLRPGIDYIPRRQ